MDGSNTLLFCYFNSIFLQSRYVIITLSLSSVIIITHALFVLQHTNNEDIIHKQEIKGTLSSLAAGVPLAVLFFLFFPRLGSPIWGSPDFFGEGKTGMSEEMSPGSISQLFNDDSTAFRVTFDSVIPSKNDLYWRGPVLWDFDGKTWTKNKNLIFANRHNSFTQSSPKITYEVELEPTGQHYLFALDYVIKTPPKSKILTDSQLMSENEINQLRHYKTTSVLKKYNFYELLSREKINRLTDLPKGFNPQTIALMQQWKKLNLTPEQLINKALKLFARDEFFYSYSPPLLYGDTVDQFLFDTKKGFCEHYASAFTVMMRAAGLPARVVTGYQGGIQNEGYLLIKQSDAHAWSEVWIPNKGWLRVDPTAAVSPLRVEQGSQALMSENARNWLDTSWYRKLGERFDGVRHKWNTWVREYNATKQKALFEVFGFDSHDGKAIAVILGSIMLLSTLIVLLFLYLTRPRRILSHYDKIYQKYLSIFIKKGLNKSNDMGVTEFADIASRQYPQVQRSINDFTELYLKLRFSKFSKKQTHLDKRLLNIIIKIRSQIGNKK